MSTGRISITVNDWPLDIMERVIREQANKSKQGWLDMPCYQPRSHLLIFVIPDYTMGGQLKSSTIKCCLYTQNTHTHTHTDRDRQTHTHTDAQKLLTRWWSIIRNYAWFCTFSSPSYSLTVTCCTTAFSPGRKSPASIQYVLSISE